MAKFCLALAFFLAAVSFLLSLIVKITTIKLFTDSQNLTLHDTHDNSIISIFTWVRTFSMHYPASGDLAVSTLRRDLNALSHSGNMDHAVPSHGRRRRHRRRRKQVSNYFFGNHSSFFPSPLKTIFLHDFHDSTWFTVVYRSNKRGHKKTKKEKKKDVFRRQTD